MSSQTEKNRRKLILGNLKKEGDLEFEKNLPIDRELFRKLFDHLDTELSVKGCDNKLTLTLNFLYKNRINDVTKTKDWLAGKGAYCDCEVLANVAQLF